MSNTDQKHPCLREDLKISKMVNKTNTHWVVKDPLKTQYFRFSVEEWDIISLFDGNRSLDEMVEYYNKEFNSDIDRAFLQDYQASLDDMNLLIKSKKDMNILLIEKVKEMREFQLLSKKGSLLYRRFPVIDPDKMFDRWIPYLKWIWTKEFFIFSMAIMLTAVAIIFANWARFTTGAYELFSFSEASFSNLVILWFIIYATIALHEFGHGLTCKYYGGEVHEIGFLLLFFQPCLYCNVNDAWLFDKKWKQIMVTISGGYVEFFIGSLCAFVWAFTSEGSAINLLSFQVMTICSVSTVMFNFNPLMKLDGYYLLSDFLEVPNLKEDAGKYIKHIVRTKLFSMPSNEFDSATKWEKKVYFFYGLASATWMFFLLTGLVGMAHGILVDKLNGLGVLLTGFIAYKIFKGHVVGSFKFLAEWAISKKSYWSKSWVRFSMGGALASIFVLLFVPVHYKVRGNCKLAPSQVRVVRAEVSAKLTKFLKNDGEQIVIGDQLAQLENAPVNFERKIAAVAVKKARQTLRKAMVDTPHKVAELKSELNGKLLELKQKNDSFEKLKVTFHESLGPKMVLSCSEQQSITQSFVQKGDEICRVMEISKLKTVIEVSEQEIRFMGPGQKVAFKLISGPIKTYYGVIEKVRPTGKSDPKNPKHKVYQLDISIENTGGLLPGMNGVAKVYANEVSLAKYGLMKLAMGLRLDLFY